MEPATIVVIVVIALAVIGIVVLPMRKRWNADGSADKARRQSIERDLVDDGEE